MNIDWWVGLVLLYPAIRLSGFELGSIGLMIAGLVRPMKRLTLIALVWGLVSGCTTQQTSLKSFYAFREQVADQLSATCDCGPIHRDPINGWIFDIQPRQQREFSIRVWKCAFLTQEEWDRNSSSTTNRVSDDITKPPTQTREQVAREAAVERCSLPDGSYDSIGISMKLQWPEMVPGEWEKQNEVNKDRDKVVRYMDQIERLLKLYHRPAACPVSGGCGSVLGRAEI